MSGNETHDRTATMHEHLTFNIGEAFRLCFGLALLSLQDIKCDLDLGHDQT